MIYISAAMRHLMCYLDGEEYSRDSTYIVLNDDPKREWLQVLQVGVYVQGNGVDDEVMVWPTPESLENALYVTAMTKDGYQYAEAIPRDKYTIVQMPVHHLGHFMACAAIVLDARANNALIDDRPSKGAANDLIAQYTLQKPPPVPKQPFAAEGTDATWLEEVEERKRLWAAHGVDVLISLRDQWWEGTGDQQKALEDRMRGATDLLLNMVNGTFPPGEPPTAFMDRGAEVVDSVTADVMAQQHGDPERLTVEAREQAPLGSDEYRDHINRRGFEPHTEGDMVSIRHTSQMVYPDEGGGP
jgi:hypothetical protein